MVADNKREQDKEITTREMAHYDPQAETIIRNKRASLVETYDDKGYVNLRGCRDCDDED